MLHGQAVCPNPATRPGTVDLDEIRRSATIIGGRYTGADIANIAD